ncbi:MAG: IS30 family transposase [Lachnospiraceae bacterium]
MARLTHSDRIKMEALLNAGHSVKEIANQLHVHQATIYREYNRGKYMHRNSDYTEEERYSSDLGQQAHDWYITGKGRPLKIKNDIKYIEKLEKKILDEKYSPEAALNALQQEGEQMCISVRTLYRYIDDGIFLKLTNAHLPVKGKAKKKEKQKPVQKRASAGVSIEKRPEEIMTREEFGHWEMDTVKGKRGVTKSCLLVLSERKTRNEIVIKMPDQGAASVVASLDMLEEKWESLCSNAKKFGVKWSDDETGSEISAIDWHVEFGEMGDTLSEIRQQYCAADGNRLEMRPYIVKVNQIKDASGKEKEPSCKEISNDIPWYSEFKSQVERIQKREFIDARGKMKELRNVLKQGQEATKAFIQFNKMEDVMLSGMQKNMTDHNKVGTGQAQKRELYPAMRNGLKDEHATVRSAIFDALEICDTYIGFEEDAQ